MRFAGEHEGLNVSKQHRCGGSVANAGVYSGRDQGNTSEEQEWLLTELQPNEWGSVALIVLPDRCQEDVADALNVSHTPFLEGSLSHGLARHRHLCCCPSLCQARCLTGPACCIGTHPQLLKDVLVEALSLLPRIQH